MAKAGLTSQRTERPSVVLPAPKLTLIWMIKSMRGRLHATPSLKHRPQIQRIPSMFNFRAPEGELAKSIATDLLNANVMIADADLTITYMNKAVMPLLPQAESDIHKRLPRFGGEKLIGSNIDVFHKNPPHQRQMLANLNATHRATIRVGGRAFALVGTPFKDKDGNLR